MNDKTPQDLFNQLNFNKESGNVLLLIFLGLLIFWAANSCYYKVGPDEDAVIIRLGKYHTTNGSGLHFKLPFGIDQKMILKTKLLHTQEFGYKTVSTKGDRPTYQEEMHYSEISTMLTGDLNVADVKWFVNYQISDPFKYLFKAKNPVRNIRDVSESIMRRVVGDELVSDLLTTGRVKISIEAKKLMQEVLDEYDIGVAIIEVNLQAVNPPEKVQPSFNAVNMARQERETMVNEAERSYNKIIPEAKGKAEKLLSQAKGHAQALINQAEGDADRFLKIYATYKQAPELTRKRIYIETMEEIFKNVEDFTLVDSNIKGLLPVYSQHQNQQLKEEVK